METDSISVIMQQVLCIQTFLAAGLRCCYYCGFLLRVGLGQTLRNSQLSSCVKCMDQKSFICLLLFYLDRSDCMFIFFFTFFSGLVWKWSPIHCTVTGLKRFNVFVFCLEKEIRTKHSDSERTLVHIDSRGIRSATF